MIYPDYTTQTQEIQLDERPPWLTEIDALDDLTPSFDDYPWRGILRVAYWCAVRNLPSLAELVVWQFVETAKREGQP